MSLSKPRYQSVEEYIAAAPAESRAYLEALRGIIRTTAPEAEECIRYDMPGYYVQGHPLVYFSHAKAHVTLHVGREPLEAMKEQLQGYRQTRGGVHFFYQKPLPLPLVEALVQCRLRQREAEQAQRG